MTSRARFEELVGLPDEFLKRLDNIAEVSAIRAISLDTDPRVITLAGYGPSEFGHMDGVRAEVCLQHPTGIAFADGSIYIADSYNHEIKSLDPTADCVETLIGTGQPGHADVLRLGRSP